MSDNRQINNHYKELADELIETMPELEYLKASMVDIVFLESDLAKKSRGGIVYANCEKVANRLKWAIPHDFIITVYTPNLQDFDERRLKILLFHEMLHIGVKGSGFYSRPHDVGDFRVIIEKYGLDWPMEEKNG